VSFAFDFDSRNAEEHELRRRRAEALEKAKAIADKAAGENRALTQFEDDKFHEYRRVIDIVDGEISARRQEARLASLDGAGGKGWPASTNPAGPPAPGGVEATVDHWLPSFSEHRRWRDEEHRAVSTSGAFIPVEYADFWYDRLRARSVVLSAGPRVVPVEAAGSMNVPKITASVTVSMLAEAGTITPSDPTLGSITLDPRKLAAICVVNSEALEDSNPELREVVSADLVRQAATTLDQQLLSGNGTPPNMRGLRNVVGVTAGPSLGANGGTPTLDNLGAMVGSYEATNSPIEVARFFMHPRTYNTFRLAKDSGASYHLDLEGQTVGARTLFGIPVSTTGNISITETQGTSTDTSYVLLVNMEQVIVGRSREVRVDVSADAYFTTDQVGLRVTGRFDIGVADPTGIVLMTGARP
jgi:HK97 family phage major capsid protein